VGPEVWAMARQRTAKPGRAQRLKSEPSTENEPSAKTIEDHTEGEKVDVNKPVKMLSKSPSVDENHILDEECVQRFIKVNVRLMTEDHVSIFNNNEIFKNILNYLP
jgi:hypothetical protein